jgi:Mrp family chromosome partitioning ATPase
MSDSCKTCPSKSEDPKGTCGAAKVAKSMQDLGLQSTLGKIKFKILVMSGKGGVGKSTVATNVAMGLAKRGYQVGLIDVDLHGPDICRMLDLKDKLYTDKDEKPKLLPPMKYDDNLKVISLEYLMENRDEAIIWRGPLKIQAIRQFIGDIDWGELDYLVIDAPPGTGDEPLSVAQTIKDVNALIVTTPQEVALADVRKSISFCRHVGIRILGLVENMSGFKLPMDPQVVLGGDSGRPYLSSGAGTVATDAFDEILDNVIKDLPVTNNK